MKNFIALTFCALVLPAFSSAAPLRPERMQIETKDSIKFHPVFSDTINGVREAAGKACYDDGKFNKRLTQNGSMWSAENPYQSFCCLLSMVEEADSMVLPAGARFISQKRGKKAGWRQLDYGRSYPGTSREWTAYEARLVPLNTSANSVKKYILSHRAEFEISCHSDRKSRDQFDLTDIQWHFGKQIKVHSLD